MAIFKCKMCGGTLEVNGNESVLTCEYCGTTQTLPKLDDDCRANLYDRANHFRRNNEFDKAMGIYEKILNEDSTDAEAYWSLVLCQYGIEYVEDPSSHKRVPTVNRAQYTSIYADENYKAALQYADVAQRSVYEQEAKTIDEIQKGILAISQKEEPFDVFICYKETDNNGRRTPDSVLANDLYHQLTQEGFKVFFSRITLEDKLGSAYEPYIFAALNSAKVMVVLGTKPEYFNAVWVRNEWSRYMTLIRGGAKKILIPAYRDMDPYDLPEEFSHLQAQDMSKLGFMQDLIRGIKKIVDVEEQSPTTIKETVVAGSNANVDSLLRRVFLFLEDGAWDSADEYCEKVLDIEPENAKAYVGKLMVELRVHTQEQLRDCEEAFDGSANYAKVLRFAEENLKNTLIGYVEHIKERNETERLEAIYSEAVELLNSVGSQDSYLKAADLFQGIVTYKDAEILVPVCLEKAEIARKEATLAKAKARMTGENIARYEEAIQLLETITGWNDADTCIIQCNKKIEEIKNNLEIDRKNKILGGAKGYMSRGQLADYEKALSILEQIPGWKDADELVIECENKVKEFKAKEMESERQKERARVEKEKRAKRNKMIVITLLVVACLSAFFVYMLNTVIIPNGKYNNAMTLMSAGKYSEAIVILETLEGYKDSVNKINDCNVAIIEQKYNNAMTLMSAGKYSEAIVILETLEGYKDSVNKINDCNVAVIEQKYNDALVALDAGNVIEGYETLIRIGEYKDSRERAARVYEEYISAKFKNVNVGDYIYFGAYEQDDNAENGKEVIEWKIIEKEGNKALLISEYGLDSQPYEVNNHYHATWLECSLRQWLNEIFVNEAFTTKEKLLISPITIDRVFLLSVEEVEKYFKTNEERVCIATAYAIKRGVYTNSDKTCRWWLEEELGDDTPGYVNRDGSVWIAGNGVNSTYAVRPVLWIELE